MLLLNRNKSVKQHLGSRAEKVAWFLWKQASLNRKLMNLASGKTKNKIISRMFQKSWGDHRSTPEFAAKSFNEQWKEKQELR